MSRETQPRPDRFIRVRGARTHNLCNIDLKLPHLKLIAICGRSGSGKSSLAIDTLYAAGRQRYIETFSTFARHFCEKLPQPDVDEISGLPPPILIRESGPNTGRRATIATVTGVYDRLRLLFAQAGQSVCPECDRPVRRDAIETVAATLAQLEDGTRLLIAFVPERSADQSPRDLARQLRSRGFRRAIVGDQLVDLEALPQPLQADWVAWEVVADRLVAGRATISRLSESLESAQAHGRGRYVAYAHASPRAEQALKGYEPEPIELEGQRFLKCQLADNLVCKQCGRVIVEPEPQLFNPQSPLGACPQCEGIGQIQAPHEATRRSTNWQTCPACRGKRLNPDALAVRCAGMNIADVVAMPADCLAGMWKETGLSRDSGVAPLIEEITKRSTALVELGIGRLSLDRPLRSLSRGERQRVRIASALGSSLVNALYVLDEPTVGLHPSEIFVVTAALRKLQQRGNTVLVIEHDAQVLNSMDLLVEMGPGAGQEGGRVVFEGTPAAIQSDSSSPTGECLSGRRGWVEPAARRPAGQGWIQIAGARSKNLKNVNARFPLNVLCAVTGISGAGKTALVVDTLHPAVQHALCGDGPLPNQWDEVRGANLIGGIELVDSTSALRTARSNPVTYVKAFDSIRRVFAETVDAKTHNYGPGFFSFNIDGGRCESCRGEGSLKVDMQFLSDIVMVCPDCGGRRYRPEALAVQYRNRSIADVLQMTVREATAFFRGESGVQARLQCLKDVGLDYLRLGQPAATLSGGEAQRLKLAAFLQTRRTSRTLFLFDEPTAGLHALDVLKLLDCFDALLAVGHSVIVVTHHRQLIRAADYLMELGPGAGEEGGRVIAAGSPEQIAANPDSGTARLFESDGQTTARAD